MSLTPEGLEKLVKKLELTWESQGVDHPKDMSEEADALLQQIPKAMKALRQRVSRIANLALESEFGGRSKKSARGAGAPADVLEQLIMDAEDMLKMGHAKEAKRDAENLLQAVPADQPELIKRLKSIIERT